MTTLNGKALDCLHRFETRKQRDAWAAAWPRASAITRREAVKLARRLHGAPLDLIPEVCADEALHTDGPYFGELAKGRGL